MGGGKALLVVFLFQEAADKPQSPQTKTPKLGGKPTPTLLPCWNLAGVELCRPELLGGAIPSLPQWPETVAHRREEVRGERSDARVRASVVALGGRPLALQKPDQ